jgi:iron complex outermembrane receptor protein
MAMKPSCPNSTRQIGVFTLQQFNWARSSWRRARAMNIRLADRHAHAGSPVLERQRDFGAVSASGGARGRWCRAGRWAYRFRAPNAPSAEELFANGPPARRPLKWRCEPENERATSVEAWCAAGRRLLDRASAYHSWFADFIYEDPTGETEDGLPVYRMRRPRRAIWL